MTPVAGGNQASLSQTVIEMTISLALSILLVYLLMVALYNGYVTPFIIMFTVPVAVVGALGALAVTHQTLNLFSLIGSILLVGLVAKNGILLVDFANQLREHGLTELEAIKESAVARFNRRHWRTLELGRSDVAADPDHVSTVCAAALPPGRLQR